MVHFKNVKDGRIHKSPNNQPEIIKAYLSNKDWVIVEGEETIEHLKKQTVVKAGCCN